MRKKPDSPPITDAEVLAWLEKRAHVEDRDGGRSSHYSLCVSKMAMGPWAAKHDGEFNYKTLREAVEAEIRKAANGPR